MLTAHERLTAPGVVLHLPRCCALAREAGVRLIAARPSRSASASCRPGLHFQPKPDSAPPDWSRLADPTPQKAIWRPLKSHR